jgi:ABC-type sulfate transport system permease component
MTALLGVQGAPLVMLALAALLRRVPGEVVLAARGLGATPEAALRRAVWPLLLPGLLAGRGSPMWRRSAISASARCSASRPATRCCRC